MYSALAAGDSVIRQRRVALPPSVLAPNGYCALIARRLRPTPTLGILDST